MSCNCLALSCSAVQEFAQANLRDGLQKPCVDALSRLGRNGRHQGNVERDMHNCVRLRLAENELDISTAWSLLRVSEEIFLRVSEEVFSAFVPQKGIIGNRLLSPRSVKL